MSANHEYEARPAKIVKHLAEEHGQDFSMSPMSYDTLYAIHDQEHGK